MSDVTIIVWHYVRDLEHSRFPAIKGRRITEFSRQLDHIAQNYNVTTAEQVIRSVKTGEPLPPRAAWLTFDDGYSDHFDNVFPLLQARGWQGSFFPPVHTTVHREMLDVNKIHFILASSKTAAVVADLRGFIEERDDLEPFEHYWKLLAYEPDQFDIPEVVFIKRLLQRELPEHIRSEFVDRLFSHHVGIDTKDFAEQLYMSSDQLRKMIAAGMYIGSHGARHYWMNRLSPQMQSEEVDDSLSFLRDLGANTDEWVMSYPYGANNQSLHTVLRKRNCVVGLTTVPGVAMISGGDPMTLPRVDTNALPH